MLDQNKVASLRYITLGKPFRAKSKCWPGLQDGEQLVASPESLDLNGKRIEVAVMADTRSKSAITSPQSCASPAASPTVSSIRN